MFDRLLAKNNHRPNGKIERITGCEAGIGLAPWCLPHHRISTILVSNISVLLSSYVDKFALGVVKGLLVNCLGWDSGARASAFTGVLRLLAEIDETEARLPVSLGT
jgi:hypothetical protein